MGVGAGLYMCDVVKKIHVRYLISWSVLVDAGGHGRAHGGRVPRVPRGGYAPVFDIGVRNQQNLATMQKRLYDICRLSQ